MPDVSSPHQYLVFRLGRVYLPPSCHSVHSQCQCRVHLLSPTETQIDSCLTSPSPSLVSVSLGSRPFHPPWPPVCSPASIVKASDDDVMRKHCLEESGTESYYWYNKGVLDALRLLWSYSWWTHIKHKITVIKLVIKTQYLVTWVEVWLNTGKPPLWYAGKKFCPQNFW